MKKIALLFYTAILSLGYFGIANAESETSRQEAIVFYSSNIVVHTDNSVDVAETIIYNTGPQEKHGIYRDIYPYSSQKRKMSIENITVTNEKGTPYQFQLSDIGDNTRIKIGDPNGTFSGQKIYIITYHATKAVAQFDSFDEIYWNVTGNEWPMPIYQAQASVVLSSATIIQSACYYGPKGSTKQCKSVLSENGTYLFNLPSTLNQNEGMTVAIGFSKGVVEPYSLFDRVISSPWSVAMLLPLLTFIFSLLYWYKKGRDARPTGVIVPQYDIPDELTPMEVAGIIYERVSVKDIPSQIIYFATKGYLKIRQIEEKKMWLLNSTDYELIQLKDFSGLSNEFDKQLLNDLFSAHTKKKSSNDSTFFHLKLFNINLTNAFSRGVDNTTNNPPSPENNSVKLSDLKYVFYEDADTTTLSIREALLTKGYYRNFGQAGWTKILLVIFLLWVIITLSSIESFDSFNSFVKGSSFPPALGVLTSIIIYGIFLYIGPSKTEKGVTAKEHLLGLKYYLQIAEKDRLQFHNAPERKPEIFERLLPYAMVLGVADVWAKEFEGVYANPPSWYVGSSGVAFSAAELGHSMNSFSSSAVSSLSSSPSGSGGGGSSGGGGGGGGGGSW